MRDGVTVVVRVVVRCSEVEKVAEKERTGRVKKQSFVVLGMRALVTGQKLLWNGRARMLTKPNYRSGANGSLLANEPSVEVRHAIGPKLKRILQRAKGVPWMKV